MPGAGSLEAFEGGSCAQQQTFSLQLPTWIDLHMCWYPLIWETSRIYGSALLTVPQQFIGTGATFLLCLYGVFSPGVYLRFHVVDSVICG